jgi:hypothetical protein
VSFWALVDPLTVRRAASEKNPTLSPDKGDDLTPWHDRRWRLEQERRQAEGENDENAGGNGGALRLGALDAVASPKALSPAPVDTAVASEGPSPGATSPVRSFERI